VEKPSHFHNPNKNKPIEDRGRVQNPVEKYPECQPACGFPQQPNLESTTSTGKPTVETVENSVKTLNINSKIVDNLVEKDV